MAGSHHAQLWNHEQPGHAFSAWPRPITGTRIPLTPSLPASCSRHRPRKLYLWLKRRTSGTKGKKPLKIEKKEGKRKVQCLCLTSQNNSKLIREKCRGRQTVLFHNSLTLSFFLKETEILVSRCNLNPAHIASLASLLALLWLITNTMPKSNLGFFCIQRHYTCLITNSVSPNIHICMWFLYIHKTLIHSSGSWSHCPQPHLFCWLL